MHPKSETGGAGKMGGWWTGFVDGAGTFMKLAFLICKVSVPSGHELPGLGGDGRNSPIAPHHLRGDEGIAPIPGNCCNRYAVRCCPFICPP
jgi:hypothetical protein